MTERRLGTGCVVHVHDSLVPIHRHHVWPLGEGGPDIPANIADVCANGHELVHHLLREARRYNGLDAVPWEVRRQFGYAVRDLARVGWDRIVRQAM